MEKQWNTTQAPTLCQNTSLPTSEESFKGKKKQQQINGSLKSSNDMTMSAAGFNVKRVASLTSAKEAHFSFKSDNPQHSKKQRMSRPAGKPSKHHLICLVLKGLYAQTVKSPNLKLVFKRCKT